MRDLAGSSAIVTGASQGIGAEVARALAREQMNLVLAARSEAKLNDLAAKLSNDNVRAIAVPTDVTDTQALEQLVERTQSEFGRMDVLVNNAGIETYSDYHRLPIEDIVRTIDVNLTSALVLTRLVLPHMIEAGRGHVVNMSSTAGKHGPAFGAAYGASKMGLVAFTESLRGEYRRSGISASVVCPGFTNEGGIYERIKQQVGRGTPFLMGATSADAVAKTVVRTVKKDLPEAIVNFPPMRPAFVLAEMLPKIGEQMVHVATFRFVRDIARARQSGSDA